MESLDDNTKEQVTIPDISIERLALAKAVTKRLWQLYDTGGHSMGRSSRSKLLEMLIDELHFSKEDVLLAERRYPESRTIHDIIRSPAIPRMHEKQLEFDITDSKDHIQILTLMSEYSFVTLLLIFLKKTIMDYEDSSHTEEDAVKILYDTFVPSIITQNEITGMLGEYNIDDIVTAHNERQHNMRLRDTKYKT